MEKLKVLLVDDEEEFVKTLSERLQLRGFAAEIAFNGERALKIVNDRFPDVMILDLKMPGIDGMEVLRQVKKTYPGIQVIILTGHGSEKDKREALHFGAYAYLQKPAEINTLIDKINSAHKYKL